MELKIVMKNIKHKIFFNLIFFLVLVSSYFLLVACNKEQHQNAKIEKFKGGEIKSNQCINNLSNNELSIFLNDFIPNLRSTKNIDQNKLCYLFLIYMEKQSPVKIQKVKSMIFNRGYGQKTVLLANGDVLIIGGDKKNNLEIFLSKEKQFERFYDKSNQILKELDNEKQNKLIKKYKQHIYKPSYNNPFRKFVVKKLNSRLILISQKSLDSSNDHSTINLVDIITGKQYSKGKLKGNRENFDAILLKNKKILIIGGNITDKNGEKKLIDNIEEYNPNTGMVELVGHTIGKYLFTKKHTLYPTQKTFLLKNNTVLIFNGKEHLIELFDPLLHRIIQKINVPYYSSIYPFNGEKFIIVPIINKEWHSCILRQCSYLYNSNEQKLIELSNICLSYPYQQLTTIKNNQILVTGGTVCKNQKLINDRSNYAAIISLK